MIRNLRMVITKIGTHNGVFHCDEALACAMLKTLPRYQDAQIVRSRDPKILDTCDIVVDVGGVFDPKSHRYDHHQREFSHSMKSLEKGPWTTKLSSAGLVYAYFGKEVISELLKTNDDTILSKLYAKVYENLMEEIDAVDNGISQTDGQARYKVTTTLGSRVGHLRPSWRDPAPNFDASFEKAMELVLQEFKERVTFYANEWWPARDLVAKALENRFNIHESGKIIHFDNGGCPFKEHLYELEKEQEIVGEVLYAVFQDTNGQWRVLAISVEDKQFESRLNLPVAWRGLRDEELSKIAEIPDCIFVHASGFIGGNKTREGAMKMAVKAFEN